MAARDKHCPGPFVCSKKTGSPSLYFLRLNQPLSGPCAKTSGWNLKNSEDPPESLIPSPCVALGDPSALEPLDSGLGLFAGVGRGSELECQSPGKYFFQLSGFINVFNSVSGTGCVWRQKASFPPWASVSLCRTGSENFPASFIRM